MGKPSTASSRQPPHLDLYIEDLHNLPVYTINPHLQAENPSLGKPSTASSRQPPHLDLYIEDLHNLPVYTINPHLQAENLSFYYYIFIIVNVLNFIIIFKSYYFFIIFYSIIFYKWSSFDWSYNLCSLILILDAVSCSLVKAEASSIAYKESSDARGFSNCPDFLCFFIIFIYIIK